MIQFSEIGNLRIRAQHILQADFSSAEDAVAYMGAMQAQDYGGALWAVALRTSSLTSSDIEAAIAKRKIIRTWPMRGTLHFLAADDAKWITQLLAPRAIRSAASRERQLDLDELTFAHARDIIGTALADGEQVDRTEFVQLLEQHGIATANQRGYHIIWRLAQEGFICIGPHRGKQPTFVLLDEWLPSARQLEDRATALRELAVRYFTSHGPATLKDFAGWGAMTLKDAKLGIDQAGTLLQKISIGTTEYWLDPMLQSNTPPSAFLLPGFDEFMLGYKDRSPSLIAEHANKIVPGNNGVFRPTIVINGQVIGTWKKTLRKSTATITLDTFVPITAQQHSMLEKTANRYGQYLGVDTVIA